MTAPHAAAPGRTLSPATADDPGGGGPDGSAANDGAPVPAAGTARRALHALYHGDAPRSHRFRYGLLMLDLLTVGFVVLTSFLETTPLVAVLDVVLGTVLIAEFAARLLADARPWRELARPLVIIDLLAVLSFVIAPIFGHAGGFLRALRFLRVLRGRRLAQGLRRDLPGFQRQEEAVMAGADLFVFIFVMTGLVFESQHRRNPEIGNYADALYFTVTALTTTGFGDITLPGTTGRMITVLIMICGVTLFLRLAQAMFRPSKVRFPCPVCALQRHDPDAVHCKACGTPLCIPDDGL